MWDCQADDGAAILATRNLGLDAKWDYQADDATTRLATRKTWIKGLSGILMLRTGVPSGDEKSSTPCHVGLPGR